MGFALVTVMVLCGGVVGGRCSGRDWWRVLFFFAAKWFKSVTTTADDDVMQ